MHTIIRSLCVHLDRQVCLHLNGFIEIDCSVNIEALFMHTIIRSLCVHLDRQVVPTIERIHRDQLQCTHRGSLYVHHNRISICTLQQDLYVQTQIGRQYQQLNGFIEIDCSVHIDDRYMYTTIGSLYVHYNRISIFTIQLDLYVYLHTDRQCLHLNGFIVIDCSV